jgi:pimeloyl-ACP methyl ester carboxylesterase
MELEIAGHRAHAYTGARTPEPGRPGVVFVHGAGLDHTVWIQQSRYLAHHGYNVLALDLPGHGRSEGPALGSIAEMADWVLEAASTACMDDLAVIGHSMGALVALEVAARAPKHIWHASLLGVSAPMPVADVLLDAARENQHAAFDMINVWGHAVRSQLGGNPAPGMWMMGGAVRLLERSGPSILAGDLAACNAFGDGHRAAAEVRCPVLLVVGTRDMMTPPRGARALVEALSGARVEVAELDGSGHMLMTERPDEVLDALTRALVGARPS